MAIESIRGCGFRKVGGVYLVGGGMGRRCDRLPYELKICPICSAGVKFTRGFQWINWEKYAGQHIPTETATGRTDAPYLNAKCSCPEDCPICYPNTQHQPYGLMWVGSEYTPESFTIEAALLGVSKRIPSGQIPRNLKLGESWVILAHNSACGTRTLEDGKEEGIPGVFYAFKPLRIEKIIWESDAKPELLEELEKRGITPVIVPDGDTDHDPKTPRVPDPNAVETAKNKMFFDNIRNKIRR